MDQIREVWYTWEDVSRVPHIPITPGQLYREVHQVFGDALGGFLLQHELRAKVP